MSAEGSGNAVGNAILSDRGTRWGTTGETLASTGRERGGNHRGTPSEATGNTGSPYRGDQFPSPQIQAPEVAEPITYRFDPTRTTNAQLLPTLAQLGIVHPTMNALDPTWGETGLFWKQWRPKQLTSSDLDPKGKPDVVADFRCLPFPDHTFDLVVFDPPYAYRGTSAHPMDTRYGIAGPYLTPDERDALIRDGITEAVRVLRHHGILLVKCQDQQVSGYLRPQSHMVTAHAINLGCRPVTILEVSGGVRPQRKPQRTASNNTSQAVVLSRGTKRRHLLDPGAAER